MPFTCLEKCTGGRHKLKDESKKSADEQHPKASVIIIGGGFAGLLCARELRHRFDVLLIDAKEYFEYTPSILRAYARPQHFEAISFLYADVLEKRIGVKFLWGEVSHVDGTYKKVHVKPKSSPSTEELPFDYCIIAAGCNFDMEEKWGESLWFPTIHESMLKGGSAGDDDDGGASQWKQFDERYRDGRRRHIAAEHEALCELNEKRGSVLVRGAGFIGVEWASEIKHYFPNIDVALVDFLPNCLGPLPKKAQDYCNAYMERVGIRCIYSLKYSEKNPTSWERVGMPRGPDKTYHCLGVKASNYFMPEETLSDRGPGGGGWILINAMLQVCTKNDDVWGTGDVYAVGDCNFASIGTQADWKDGKGVPYIPKLAYPAEEQSVHVCRTLIVRDMRARGKELGCCIPRPHETWWPWGSGMYAISLGPYDGCFVAGSSSATVRGAGCMALKGCPAVLGKELIEASKVSEQKGGCLSRGLWYMIHHTRVHLWGKGPWYVR